MFLAVVCKESSGGLALDALAVAGDTVGRPPVFWVGMA
jgi:hypothetical protein